MSINPLEAITSLWRCHYLTTNQGNLFTDAGTVLPGSLYIGRALSIAATCYDEEIDSIKSALVGVFDSQIRPEDVDIEMISSTKSILERQGLFKNLSPEERANDPLYQRIDNLITAKVNMLDSLCEDFSDDSSEAPLTPSNVDFFEDSSETPSLPPEMDESHHPSSPGINSLDSPASPASPFTTVQDSLVASNTLISLIPSVTTAWLLDTVVNKDIAESLKTHLSSLYEKSLGEEKLSELEWVEACRCAILLMQQPLKDMGLDQGLITHDAEKIFFSFFIVSGVGTSLPPELFVLHKLLPSHIDEKIQIYRELLAKNHIPSISKNGTQVVNLVEDVYIARNKDIELSGLPTPLWTKRPAETDSKCLNRIVNELAAKPSFDGPDDLKHLIAGLAWLMHKRIFESDLVAPLTVIAKKLPIVEEMINRTNPYRVGNPLHSNFIQLYEFFKKSRFLELVGDDGGEVWPGGVGGTRPEFECSDLVSHLNTIKKKLASLKNAESLVFSEIPPQPIRLDPLENEFRFPVEKNEALLQAQNLKKSLKKQFMKEIGDVDVSLVVESFKQGKIPLSFYGKFVDGGQTLLRDYVYPICIYESRSEINDGDHTLKYFNHPASAEMLAGLNSDMSDVFASAKILANTIQVMFRSAELGGKLKGCPIQEQQIGMMEKFRSAIVEGKPVTISSDTGTGKTLVASIANEIFSLETPYIIHIAPFGSKAPGWKKLESFDQVIDREGVNPEHFWITTEGMKKLCGQPYPKILEQSLFVLDEYDSEAYRLNSSERIQDALFFGMGCKRILNMSATGSIGELENKIERKQQKLQEYQDRGEETAPKAVHLEKNIKELVLRKATLVENLRNEFSRNIELKALPTQEDPIAQIIHDIKSLEIKSGESCLIEMPDIVIDSHEETANRILNQFTTSFPDKPIALLYRDHEGKMYAKIKDPMGLESNTIPYESFESYFKSQPIKPTVFCLYTADSIGGDFEDFSNQQLVRGQFIVYQQDIVGSHSIYQHLKRERRGEGAHLNTPVNIYLAEKIRGSLPPDNSEAKTKLLEIAEDKYKGLSAADEAKRLMIKISRKKEKVVREIIMESDFPQISQNMEAILKPLLQEIFASPKEAPFIEELMEKIQHSLKQWFVQELKKMSMRHSDDINETRGQVLRSIFSRFTPPLTGYFSVEKENRYNQLLKIKGEMDRQEVDVFLNDICFKGGAQGSYISIWTKYLQNLLKDPSISQSEAKTILQRIRNDSSIPETTHVAYSPRRKFAPDKFKKFILGNITKSTAPFKNGLERASGYARAYEEKKQAYVKGVSTITAKALSRIQFNPIPEAKLKDVQFYQAKYSSQRPYPL